MVRLLPAAVAIGVLTGAAAADQLDCSGVNAININCSSPEAPYTRDAFYVGGRAVNASTGTLTADQLYVEKLTPTGSALQTKPLVFFHGGGIAGSTWLQTPDNREGFASYFIRQGYVVYIVDTAAIGRSADNDLTNFTTTLGTSTENIEQGFTAVELYDDYPQAQLHTQWPGTGLDGDPAFDAFKKSFLPLTSSYVAQEYAMRASGCELLSLLGADAYLISHSLGARFPILMSNDCPQYIAASINLEAASLPFWSYSRGLGGSSATPWGFTNTYLSYDPPISDSSGRWSFVPRRMFSRLVLLERASSSLQNFWDPCRTWLCAGI